MRQWVWRYLYWVSRLCARRVHSDITSHVPDVSPVYRQVLDAFAADITPCACAPLVGKAPRGAVRTVFLQFHFCLCKKWHSLVLRPDWFCRLAASMHERFFKRQDGFHEKPD